MINIRERTSGRRIWFNAASGLILLWIVACVPGRSRLAPNGIADIIGSIPADGKCGELKGVVVSQVRTIEKRFGRSREESVIAVPLTEAAVLRAVALRNACEDRFSGRIGDQEFNERLSTIFYPEGVSRSRFASEIGGFRDQLTRLDEFLQSQARGGTSTAEGDIRPLASTVAPGNAGPAVAADETTPAVLGRIERLLTGLGPSRLSINGGDTVPGGTGATRDGGGVGPDGRPENPVPDGGVQDSAVAPPIFTVLDSVRVTFSHGSADISDTYLSKLRSDLLCYRFEPVAFSVVGSTDPTGSRLANERLSTARGQIVARWLSRDLGIPPTRISTTGVGVAIEPGNPDNLDRRRSATIYVLAFGEPVRRCHPAPWPS